MSAGKNN